MATVYIGGQGGASGAYVPPVNPVVPPTFLPAITATRASVLSPYKLLSTYSGPTMNVQPVGGGTAVDIYPVAGGQAPDVSGLTAGTTYAVNTLYDQAGSNNHVSQASVSRPTFSTAAGLIRGKLPIVFDGNVTQQVKELGNATLTVDRRNSGCLTVAAVLGLGAQQYLTTLGASSADYIQVNGSAGSPSKFRTTVNGSAGSPGLSARTNTSSFGQINAAGSTTLLTDGRSQVVTQLTAGTTGAGSWIGSFYANGTALSDFSLFADIIYATAPSQADYDADRAALATVFDTQDWGVTNYNVVFDGDSRRFGVGGANGVNLMRQLVAGSYLSGRPNLVNVGIPGITAALIVSQGYYPAYQVALYDSTKAKNVYSLMIGTNDINALANGAAVSASASAIQANINTLVQSAQSIGFDVVVSADMIRTNWSADAANKEAIRQALNTLLKNNASAGGYTFVDLDTLAPTLSANLFDGVHPNNAGYAIQAGAEGPIVSKRLTDMLPLKLAPSSATATQAYSAVISGITPGATGVTATSSDGTVLTVGALAANGTAPVTGIFAAAGSPVITLTETNPGATNGPTRVTTINVTVAAYVAPFVQDTFTGTSGTAITAHTGEVGATWTVQSGNTPATPAQLDGNGALYGTAATDVYQASGAPNGATAADYYVEGVFAFLSTISGDSPAIAARMQTGANTYYFVQWSQANGGWRLFRIVAGTTAQLGTTLADTFTSGSKTVRLTVSGSTISASVNGTQFASVTDTNITTAGFAGVRMGSVQTATTGIHIDNLIAVKLS